MSASVHSGERYGAPSPLRRWVLTGLVAVVVLAFLGWLAWTTLFHADPEVSSELITSEIVDDHTATAVIRVTFGDPDDPADARCTVRAYADDHSTVGEVTFTPDPDEGPDYEVEIATVMRATAIESIGCTADGQPRPR